MPQIPCVLCSELFYTKPSWQKRGHGKYCSRLCAAKSSRKGKLVNCHICGEQIYRQLRFLKKSKTGKFFCSKKCSIHWQNTVFVGPKHPNWKHGMGGYYRYVLKKLAVPQECRRCRTSDTRVLLVHHLDGNRENSVITNLVWLCQNCHFLVHRYPQESVQVTSYI